MSKFPRLTKLLLPAFFALLTACPALAAPAPRAYVNDTAGVLGAQTAARLDAVLADLDARAKAQVAVLTVKTLGDRDIETYAVETYKKWGIGDKRTSRGVLLLVAVEDRKSRIEVGYGLEGILPDGLTGAIQDEYMLPYFKAGDYAGGVTQGSLALAAAIAKDSGITLAAGAQGGRRQARPLSARQKILSALLLVGFIIFAIRHPVLAILLLQSVTRSGGGFGGGGFGGFGGGSSGGGGSSRSW